MFKTPGVYIQEVSTLPPSVVEVATAVPAFIGYTEKGAAGEVEVAEVNTLLEYEERFGKAKATNFTATADGAIKPPASSVPETPLWYALSLYFKNGGGRCYVVSVDNHETTPDAARYTAGLTALESWDEPTLIVMPGATALAQDAYYTLCQDALKHCKKMGDRFTILDVKQDAKDAAAKDGKGGKDAVQLFRDGIGTDGLMYGAAYHPYLKTSLPHVHSDASVKDSDGGLLSALKDKNTARYNLLKKNLADQRVELPPSAAMAGIYARVDRDRGVWKAPANVSVSSVIGPTIQITHEGQDRLNVDDTSGKSINAIRAFSGQGTMVWGARTLAGNDNEWRYVNVRRLFITVEESAKKASNFAVFETNDASTWLKVRGMLESYLYGLWEQGALQGSKPESAYFVNVGLGRTMTPQDVLEGRLIVELGLAAVRPAEFITLRFSHKLPEA
jgi:Bacteriophage tail sheath protein